MEDRFYDFCNDDTVRDALCDILAKHVEDWYRASRRVVIGLDTSRVARQYELIEASRVMGMADLVCLITGLTPEDIVSLDPEKYRTLILYVASHR